VAVVAAFADVDVAAGQTQRRVGFRPATGSVVDFWKNSGKISTAPPTLTTSTPARSAAKVSFNPFM
jgi:hypothetical protein